MPMLVVDEVKMKRGGDKMKVIMEGVVVDRIAGGLEQAVGIRCRQEWHRHRMGREQLVGITGQKVQGAVGGHHRTEGAGRCGSAGLNKHFAWLFDGLS